MLGPFLAISTNNENSLRFFIRAHAQNTINSSISLAVNNVISFLIGPKRLVPITSIRHHMGEGAPLGPLSVTGNGSGRVTEPKHYQFMPKIRLILEHRWLSIMSSLF